MRARYYGCVIAAALIAPGIAHAQEQTRASVDVAPGVGYSSNPFSGTGSNLASGYAALDVTPRFELLMPQDTLTVTGNASLQKYFTNYADATSYRVSTDYRGRPSERVNTHMRVDLTSAIIGAYDSVGGAIEPGVPSPTDLALFGTRDRRRGVYATGDFDAALSARDSISASVFYEIARYRRFADISDYDGLGSTFSYNRQLSGNTRIGAQGAVSRYDYRGARGRTNVYTISATASTKLNEYWTVDGSLGVSFVNSSSTGSTGKASPSGNINLCRQGPLSNFCITGSRSVRPTGFNGSQYVNSIGANWSRKLSEFTTLSARALYTTEGGSQSALVPGIRAQYLTTSATYERRLSERLRLTATGQYRQIFASSLDRPADYGGRLGLSYRFGDPR